MEERRISLTEFHTADEVLQYGYIITVPTWSLVFCFMGLKLVNFEYHEAEVAHKSSK